MKRWMLGTAFAALRTGGSSCQGGGCDSGGDVVDVPCTDGNDEEID